MKKALLAGMALFVTFGLTAMTASAVGVWFDFDGDMLPDPVITPAVGTITGALDTDAGDPALGLGGLLGWGVEIDYSPPVIIVNGVTIDIDNAAGLTNALDYTLPAQAASILHLADVTFGYLGGTGTIGLQEYLPGEPSYDSFVTSDMTVLDPILDFMPTAIAVPNGIPEPSTIVLMGLGLVGLGVAGRRKLVG
jgi:hypothetical protein